MQENNIKVGAAQIEITPERGIQIAGDIGRRRPAEVIIDPIYAKAMVVTDEKQKLCILSLDVTAINKKWASRIREQAAEKFGFAPEAVMVHVTQNHAAPQIGHTMTRFETEYIPADLQWLRGGDERYNNFAMEKVLQAIEAALNSLQSAYIGVGRGIDDRIAFNRRFVMRDGTVTTHPSVGDPNILYCEGPIDPEVGVMYISTTSLKPLAMLLHHTCHPVHGYPHNYITSGWPGAWASVIQDMYGANNVPLILNGCCGNIHHRNHLDPVQVDDYHHLGELLAETTEKVIKDIKFQNKVKLEYRSQHIKIPLRELDKKEITSAENLLAENSEPMWLDKEKTKVDWDWMYAVSLLDFYKLCQEASELDYEIQILRIGDTAVIALGGEPFVEGQLEIKLNSPATYTFLAHMSNYYVGYIPTRKALNRGGYETNTANWSKLAPEALTMISDATISLLGEIFN